MQPIAAALGTSALDMGQQTHAPASAARAFSVVPGGSASASRPQHASSPRSKAACAAVLALLALAFLVGAPLALRAQELQRQDAVASIAWQDVRVRPGESLWSIAQDHGVDGLSTDVLVDAIKHRNDLNQSMLMPGQLLSVPCAQQAS